LPRADVSATVGWLHANVSNLSETYDAWANRRATLNGEAGVYWTEHWKTEFAAERSNTQDRWHSTTVPLPEGGETFRVSEHHIQDTRLSIGQFYQFGHNAWAHVLLGGGISVTRRYTLTDIRPLQRYDRSGGVVIIDPGRTESSSDTRASPFASAATKAYLTTRVFVRADAQADFRSSLEAVVLRIGLGVDF